MYQQTIREIQAEKGMIGKHDPRHIEGYMRLQYGTLGHLSRNDFEKEVDICSQCIMADGEANAEANAKSFGL